MILKTTCGIWVLYMEGKGPGTYAELFRGDFDIIDEFTDYICEKLSIE